MGDSRMKTLEELTMLEQFSLEDLLDRRALPEMLSSFQELTGVPARIYSLNSGLLAGPKSAPPLDALLEGFPDGRRRLRDTIHEVLSVGVTVDDPAWVECAFGAGYLVSQLDHDGRALGRIVLGPVRMKEATQGFSGQVIRLPEDKSLELSLEEVPEKTLPECKDLLRFFQRTLDVLAYSGFKAHLASSMHLATVRENFRELTDKNTKLQSAYDRLRELDRLKSNFLATVSHELRTPLTSIIGYSEMLLEGISGELNEEQREFLGTIHQKGEQLLELIKSLLDLSKLESGTMSLRKGNVDCGALARDVATTLAPTARKKNVSLAASVNGELPLYNGDAERLRQILLNLTENAIKFTPADGSVEIEVRLVEQDVRPGTISSGAVLGSPKRRVIEIRVADSGVGIPEDQRERVFDAFYQVDNSSTREVGGSGLGLSIVKRLVDAHDGQVYIESNEPRGTVFVVSLPCK